MTSVWIEILVIFLLILINGFLSMSEIAIVSARRVRLLQMAEDGNTGAQIALKLAHYPSRFLSTVQIGITLVGILTGVFGGAAVSSELARFLGQWPLLQPYSELLGVGLVVLMITYLTLVLGELTPKQVALNRVETVASAVAPVMLQLSRLTTPFVYLLSASSNLVLRLLGVKPSSEQAYTEEDIRGLIEQGVEEGVFTAAEEGMVQQLFRLGDRRAYELMTPRTEVITLDIRNSFEENRARIAEGGFSRFPLVDGNLDHVLGLVRAKDLLLRYLHGEPPDLKAAMRPALFVPETTLAVQVLEQFRQTRLHMAFVLDEYGGVQGILTPTDILESIVGDIPDLDDDYDPAVTQREDGSWLIDGSLPAQDIKHILNIKHLPDEEENSYQTLGGMVMVCLGRIPITGDSFDWGGLRFEVVDMDGRRVDKVLVRPIATA